MVENPSCNARDAGSIPGRGTKIPHVVGQLSPRATTRGPASLNERSGMQQQRPDSTRKKKKKSPIFKYSHILRYWGLGLHHMNLGWGHNSVHNTWSGGLTHLPGPLSAQGAQS